MELISLKIAGSDRSSASKISFEGVSKVEDDGCVFIFLSTVPVGNIQCIVFVKRGNLKPC